MARFIGYERCPKCDERGRDRRGDNLAIYSDGGAHCFSCSFHRHPVRSMEHIPKEKYGAKDKSIPADFTREVPTAAWQWLLQYGLGWKYWQPFVGWSEQSSRLVFPVGSCSLGRLIGRPPTDRERKWFCWGEKPVHVIGNGGRNVVLVEDIVSAHKVGQVCDTIPLFGTKTSPMLVPVLRRLAKPIVMWQDKDQAEHASRRASWLAMVTGLPVRYVFTDKDPKEQPMDRIQALLGE